MNFNKLFVRLLHFSLHYVDQRWTQEVPLDVILYLHPASADGTEIYTGFLTNQIWSYKRYKK